MKTNLRLIGGKKLHSPNNIFTRPTTLRVREAIFNIMRDRVKNSNWLDLFSGTGAISCEAYNHGARKIIAIEKNKINSAINATIERGWNRLGFVAMSETPAKTPKEVSTIPPPTYGKAFWTTLGPTIELVCASRIAWLKLLLAGIFFFEYLYILLDF